MKSIYKFFLIMGLLCGCNDYLEIKPDRSLLIPSTLEDFQALLDHDRQMLNQDPFLTFIGADNYYILDESWQTLYSNIERNGYIWEKEIYERERVPDWSVPYEQVFIANIVLEGLEGLPVGEKNKDMWKRIKGSALFFRAYAFYNLLQVFAVPYDPDTAKEAAGIPLRLTSDLEVDIHRNGLNECYEKVIVSLKEAADLLPESTDFKTRPNKAAAYGLLSRVFLTMQNYEQAKNFASQSLEVYSTLLDYSTLDSTRAIPFVQHHKEVIFHSVLLAYNIRSRAYVVPELYAFYASDDLRKTLFFEDGPAGHIEFTGRYSGQSFLFGGLATDEIYLIRAECRARLGDTEGAMADLNTLMETRWKPGTFEPFTAISEEEALMIILKERRKELLFRGLRWSDLRRLNQDPRFAKTLKRDLNGKTYKLPPNDPRYVYPIPEREIDLNSLIQNPR